MPRIDPLQLLDCLHVLLSRNGGIQSRHEVQRLVNLMTKFSKKLVSKCIYVLILKNTEASLIGQFMAEGGWSLIYQWLQDAVNNNNNSLIKELLELLILTPVDVDRLKTNNIPKLVKNLSKKDDLEVQQLADKLVHIWLKIVKDQTQATVAQQQQTQTLVPVATPPMTVAATEITVETSELTKETDIQTVSEPEKNAEGIDTSTFYKLTVRDGKQVISRFPQNESPAEEKLQESKTSIEESNENETDGSDKKQEKSNHDRNKHKNSKTSSSSRSSSSSSKDKHRDKEKSSSSSSKDKKSSKDKDRKDKSKEKDKHRSNGSLKSSNSSSKSSNSKDKEKKDTKEKQAEKDKDTLAKVLPQSIQKLGRIPKKPAGDEKSKENRDVKKDKNFSIEPRKNNEERPRTVKVYNAKMRSTGLEEEVKPPPPRSVKKSTSSVILPSIPQKRPSPIKDLPAPPEKKSKVEIPERPGAIKLIPPKPKPAVLQESDIFMDALTASATAKKEPKKRKRRASVSKDSNSSPPQSPAQQTAPSVSPNAFKNITPPKFYQDTLETTEKENDNEGAERNESEAAGSTTPTDIGEPAKRINLENKIISSTGLKGVLLHTKRSGPKKSLRWKEENLVEVHTFELDETERVNVTKNFMDMARMEMTSEREALQMSRKLPNEDLMDSQTNWRVPIPIDLPEPLAVPGSKSLEKNIQFAREKNILQALYFNKRMIPDSPAEPDPEIHQMTDPAMIPLEDPENTTGEEARVMPWPDPKGSPPPEPTPVVPQIFPAMQGPFPAFPNMAAPPHFQGMPPFANPGNFMPPNMMPGGPEWNNMNNGQMMPPNMGPHPQMMNPNMPMNPNMFGGPPGPGGPPPDGFNAMNDNNFPMQFNQPNMFPPNNFNMNRGRGAFRRGGGGPWVRMNAPGGWHNRGGAHRGGRLCKNVQNHGYCRNRDTCHFLHPN